MSQEKLRDGIDFESYNKEDSNYPSIRFLLGEFAGFEIEIFSLKIAKKESSSEATLRYNYIITEGIQPEDMSKLHTEVGKALSCMIENATEMAEQTGKKILMNVDTVH